MAIKIKRRRIPLDEKQRRRRQTAIIALFIGAALFFAGFSLGKPSETDTTKTETKAESAIPVEQSKTEVTGVGPRNFDLIVPTGYDKSEAGAIKAGATYVESWAQLVLSSDAEVIAAINEVTTPSADSLRLGMSESITKARAAVSDSAAGQVYHQSVPMKIKVESYDDSNATLVIWTASFWAGAGTIEPQGNFDLHTLKLVYVDNDWKIDSWSTGPGPTPVWTSATDPTTSIDFFSALAGFEEYKR